MAGGLPCKIELNASLKLLGCPNPNDQVLLIKSDGTTPLLMPYASFLACLYPPKDIWGIVGTNGNVPVDGATIFQSTKFIGWHVELTVNEVPIYYVEDGVSVPQDGTFYYTKAVASDTAFGGNNFTFRNGDRVHARMYLGQEDVQADYIIEEDGTTNISDESGNSLTND